MGINGFSGYVLVLFPCFLWRVSARQGRLCLVLRSRVFLQCGVMSVRACDLCYAHAINVDDEGMS